MGQIVTHQRWDMRASLSACRALEPRASRAGSTPASSRVLAGAEMRTLAAVAFTSSSSLEG